LEDFLLLIDGSSLLSVSFYGNLPEEYKKAKTEEDFNKALTNVLHTSDGLYTNGVYSFFKTLLSIVKKQKPSHLAIAWDKNRNTFRRDLYSQYKENRKDVRTELKSQFEMCQKTLEYIGVKQYIIDGYEADDIIGAISKRIEDKLHVRILSKDKDVLQLISENTDVWYINPFAYQFNKDYGIDTKTLNIPEKVALYNKDILLKSMEIEPKQVIELKALQGDTSDNIPGIPGVGEKTALSLIKFFKNIYSMYDIIEKTDLNTLKENLKNNNIKRVPIEKIINNKELAILSHKLAKINTDIDTDLYYLPFIDYLKTNIDVDKLRKIFTRLEFKSLLANS